MILIDSIYINNSGGKVLLDYLIEQVCRSGLDVFFLFDERCKQSYQHIQGDKKVFLQPSFVKRHQFYLQNKSKFSCVLCFGNVPPTVHISYPVFIYFHNVSFIDQPDTYKWIERMTKKLKYFVIRLFNSSNYVYVVQTEFVRKLLVNSGIRNTILIIPFYNACNVPPVPIVKENDSFVYISNGNTHKNHFRLFRAWEILAGRGLFPTLHVTITSQFTKHLDDIQRLNKLGCQIVNHGFCDPTELYQRSKYLIYPSLTESFGLGLVEAIAFKCEVIASDLDYVYEVCEPYLTFDPLDELSIADTVELATQNADTTFYTKQIINNDIHKLITLLHETDHSVL